MKKWVPEETHPEGGRWIYDTVEEVMGDYEARCRSKTGWSEARIGWTAIGIFIVVVVFLSCVWPIMDQQKQKL